MKCFSLPLASLAMAAVFAAPFVPAAVAEKISPAEAYAKVLTMQEQQVVAVAQAMPADKYNFAPTDGDFKGVRTFGQQLTHVAQAQYFFFSGWGVKPSVDPSSLKGLTSKEDIVKALKASFAYAHQAVETMTVENAFDKVKEVDGADTRSTIAAFDLAHTNDHYGQMIEYLRMNNVEPPK